MHICVRERERERKRESVCPIHLCVGERERERASACVSERVYARALCRAPFPPPSLSLSHIMRTFPATSESKSTAECACLGALPDCQYTHVS